MENKNQEMTSTDNTVPHDAVVAGAGGVDSTKEFVTKVLEEEQKNTVSPEPLFKNFNLRFPIFKKLPDQKERKNGQNYKIALPSGPYKELRERYRNSIGENPSKAMINNVAVFQATEGQAGDQFFDTLAGEDEFIQAPEFEGHVLRGSRPPINNTSGALSGNRAVAHVRNILGLGYGFNVPLWHSGFWVRIKTPNEAEILDFYRELSNQKISLGRQTFGLAFNNNKVYMVEGLIEFAKRHVTDTNLDVPDDFDWTEVLDIRDLEIIAWGMACSIWTNGFTYARSCTSDLTACTHVVEDLVDVIEMLFVRKQQLTKYQLAHMAKRGPKLITLDALKKYNGEFIVGTDRVVKISDRLSITLTTPKVKQYITQGKEWVAGIEEEFGRAATMSEDERDSYLTQQGLASRLRQYTHYVKEINADGIIVQDEDATKDIINVLSGVDLESSEFMKAMKKYIDDSQVALIAIPSFKCPACGKEQTTPDDKYHGHLIPVDPFTTFFTLVRQLTEVVSSRQN